MRAAWVVDDNVFHSTRPYYIDTIGPMAPLGRSSHQYIYHDLHSHLSFHLNASKHRKGYLAGVVRLLLYKEAVRSRQQQTHSFVGFAYAVVRHSDSPLEQVPRQYGRRRIYGVLHSVDILHTGAYRRSPIFESS